MKTSYSTYFKQLLLVGLIIMFIPATSYCQSSRQIASLLDTYFSAVKENTERPDLSGLLNKPKKYANMLYALEKHYNDSLYSGVQAAYKLTYTIALRSNENTIQQQAVETLTAGIKNNNSSAGAWCVTHLSVFPRNSFNNSARQNITASLQHGTPKLNELVKVAGYLKMEDQISNLETIANNSQNISDKWAVWLALSRMANDKYTSRVAQTVRRQKLNDDVVYELVPDLIYTRQKAAIDIALEILNNTKKNCYSSSPDNPVRIQCGYRVMEYLAPVITDFPYGVKTSGDIDTDNYEKALTEVRKWFLEKGNNYIIIDNSF